MLWYSLLATSVKTVPADNVTYWLDLQLAASVVQLTIEDQRNTNLKSQGAARECYVLVRES